MNVENIKANLQLVGTRISKLSVENDFVELNLNDESINRGIDVSYKTSQLYTIENEPDFLAGNILMDIKVGISDRIKNLSLELELEGCFVLDSKDEDKMKEMLSVNGTAALYSIARGIVSSVTSHICTNGTVILPMINVFRLKKEDE